MWLTLRILGVEIFDLTIGCADRSEESESKFISNTGGSYEIAGEAEPEWDDEDGEYDPEYDNRATRRPPFGFMHA
jgi:hypothetical protein